MLLISGIKSILTSIWGYRAVRTAISLVFIISGAGKLFNPEAFAVTIDAYGLLPGGLTLVAVYGLILLELTAGVALLLDIRGGLSLIAVMLLVFMAILIYGIQMGLDVDCGCFGPEDPESKAFHDLRPALYRDVLILGGIVYLYLWRSRSGIAGRHLRDIFTLNMKGRKI